MHTCQWRSHQRLEDIGKGSHTAWFRQCSNTSQTLRGVTGFRVMPPTLGLDFNRLWSMCYITHPNKKHQQFDLCFIFFFQWKFQNQWGYDFQDLEKSIQIWQKKDITTSGMKYIYRHNLLTNFKHHFNGNNNNHNNNNNNTTSNNNNNKEQQQGTTTRNNNNNNNNGRGPGSRSPFFPSLFQGTDFGCRIDFEWHPGDPRNTWWKPQQGETNKNGYEHITPWKYRPSHKGMEHLQTRICFRGENLKC